MLLPLFPLPGVVLFPGARLPLHVFEPRYRRLVADLLDLPEAERRIGLVYAARMNGLEAEEMLEPGCAGRLVEHAPLADGRSNIVLAGEFRFRIERELARGPHRPYRMAEVTRLAEPLPLVEHERLERAGRELLALAAAVVGRSGGSSPLDLAELAGLGGGARLPVLANRIAARLDLPPLRKQTLLALDPLERAEEIGGILRSRVKLLDCLGPYRLLGCEPALN
jgi:Lon protease-like protein